MYLYPEAVSPAVRSHLDAQLAFFNEMSKTLTQSIHDLFNLNMRLSQSFLEEAGITGQQMLAAKSPAEAITVAGARAHPASQSLVAYHQQVSKAAADTQVELTRVSEKHVQETSRTASVLANEVKRAAADQTERNVRQQQEMSKRVRDPLESFRGNMQGGQSGQSAQFEQSILDAQAVRPPQPVQPGQQPERKGSIKPNG
jgi:phasin family protein